MIQEADDLPPETRDTSGASELSLGNRAMREGRYHDAVRHYEQALQDCPEMAKSVTFNLELARKKLTNGGSPEPRPTAEAPRPAPPAPDIAFDHSRGESGVVDPFFDRVFYLSCNPDVLSAGVDPLEHFCGAGWREGRDPSPDFSTRYYLDANPDVAEAGVNPFWHYLVAGRSEGRTPRHPGGYKADILTNLAPLEETVRHWECSVCVSLLGSGELRDALLDCGQSVKAGLVFSFGHDNYLQISGGVQLCIQREQEAALARGFRYLNIHPAQALPRLAKDTEDCDPVVTLVLDGRLVGHCRTSSLLDIAPDAATAFTRTPIVVHSLLGHMPEQVAALAKALGHGECWFWLHDFLSICPSFALQRNAITFCGAPQTHSNACSICVYGVERPSHAQRMRTFFESVAVHVLSPSEVTRDFWTDRSGLPYSSLAVEPHMSLEWRPRRRPAPVDPKAPMSVAFIGAPVPHKGWEVFRRLVSKHRGNPRFRFVYFGVHDIAQGGVERVPVHVTLNNYSAMLDAIAEKNIDVVLHWASWPETFSFTTYEAIAGGAYVVTNSVSGNVAATVERLGRGVVLPDERALDEFFASSAVSEMVGSSRKARRDTECVHSMSEMTVSRFCKE